MGPLGPEQVPRKEGAMKGSQEEVQSETRPGEGAKRIRTYRKTSQQVTSGESSLLGREWDLVCKEVEKIHEVGG